MGAPRFFRGRSTQTLHDSINKGFICMSGRIVVRQNCCTFAPSYYRGMTETERNLLYGVVSLILPENILDQFDIVKFEEEDIARNDGSYQPFKRNGHTKCQTPCDMAIEQAGGGDLSGLIHHSDRGIQYCCDLYVEELRMRAYIVRTDVLRRMRRLWSRLSASFSSTTASAHTIV